MQNCNVLDNLITIFRNCTMELLD